MPAVREAVEQSTAQIRPTVEAVTGAKPVRSTVQAVTTSVSRASPQTGPALATVARRLEAIDPASGATLPTPQTLLDTLAAAEQARSAASSTSASGDDGGLDVGQPPFGFDGGGSPLGGPAGIALLGLLAAILALIPRFSTRLLHMSPARWGLVAFLVPIERPG